MQMQLQLEQFNFELPHELIAQYPLPERSASKLLYLNNKTGKTSHFQFSDLPLLLSPNDLLIFNDTRVIKARLYGKKITGGKVEILIERVINEYQALCQIKASKKIKIGMEIILVGNDEVVDIDANAKGDWIKIINKQNDFFVVEFYSSNPSKKSSLTILQILNKYGKVPLPPYIERSDAMLDEERYQSIFAKHDGAVAAPTASLHFDQELIEAIKAKGIDIGFITLHVGAGTFQPVRVENIEEHKMHAEYVEVTQDVCDKIKAAKARKGRVIAVGTTCVRCLETAAKMAAKDATESERAIIKPFFGDTDIFIYSGFNFRCVDALITNFHLPKSTLLMLVCAFSGYENVMRAYNEAIKLQYRFFSYGDAMFVAENSLYL